MEIHEAPAFLGPLASGRRSYHRHAGAGRRALEGGLNHADKRFLFPPPQPVIAEHLGGMRAVRRQNPVVDLAVRHVGHRGQVEGAVVVGRVAPTAAVGGIGVGQAGVVTRQLAVGIRDGAEPAACGALRKAELGAVVTAGGRNHGRALGAERNTGQVIAIFVDPFAGVVVAGDGHRPMENVGDLAAGVPDVETQVVGDRHVFDRPVEALARVAALEAPVRSDGPVHPRHDLVLFHRLHFRVEGRVPRIFLGGAEVHVLDETAHRDTRRRTGRRTTAAQVQSRSDLGIVGIIQGIHTVVPVVGTERAARQAELHDVEELAVARIHLDLAVVEQVVGAADTRGDLVAPTEVDRVEHRTVRRDVH